MNYVTCPDAGACHGCASWCDACGSVRTTCDAPRCMRHRCRTCGRLLTDLEHEFQATRGVLGWPKYCFDCEVKYWHDRELDRGGDEIAVMTSRSDEIEAFVANSRQNRPVIVDS